MHDRHEDLQRAGGGHLLADDLLDLSQTQKSERQKTVNAGGVLADVARSFEQIMTDRFDLGATLPERATEQLREAHFLNPKQEFARRVLRPA